MLPDVLGSILEDQLLRIFQNHYYQPDYRLFQGRNTFHGHDNLLITEPLIIQKGAQQGKAGSREPTEDRQYAPEVDTVALTFKERET